MAWTYVGAALAALALTYFLARLALRSPPGDWYVVRLTFFAGVVLFLVGLLDPEHDPFLLVAGLICVLSGVDAIRAAWARGAPVRRI
jgi:hypothetical protein